MTTSRQQRVEELFEQLADLPRQQRRHALDDLKGDDAELRAELEDLLTHDQRDTQDFFERPAVDVHDDATLPPGTRIGPYELNRLVGEGGFGQVYLARQHEPLQRDVALKIIKLGMDTRRIVRRFRDEQQTLAMLDHPNVARVLDAGTTDAGRPYFVMDFVHGAPITDHARDAQLDTDDRLRLILQVCDAVQHAHQKGIIHRDIKPSNILVETIDNKPLVRVIDFGIAKAITADPGEQSLLTEKGLFLGTPTYMSPEQVLGHSDIDTRADVYAIGILMYELLTGSPPFDPQRLKQAGLSEIERMIRNEDPPKPSSRVANITADPGRPDFKTLRKQIAGDLDWIIIKAIEKNRDDRYASASELAADITRRLRHEPVAAGPPSTMYRVRKFVRRNRTPVIAAAIALVGLIAAIAGTTVGMMRARDAEAQARTFADAESAARAEAESARAKAELEADKATTVLDFLVDTLSTADPDNAEGREPTIREVIDDAVAQMDNAFDQHPITEAEIRSALGLIYKSLGKYPEALTQLRRALDLQLEHAPDEIDETDETDETDEIARRKLNVALVLEKMQDYTKAEPLARSAVDMTEKLYGPEHDRALSAQSALASILIAQEKLDEAEAILTRTLETRKRLFAKDDSGYTSTLSHLTDLYRAKGKMEESLPLLRELLEIEREKHGDDHSKTIAALNNLGNILNQIGRSAEAEPFLREAAERYVRVFGDDHPGAIIAQGNYATLLRELERFDEAIELFQRIVDKSKTINGPEHPSTIRRMTGLAETYIAMKQFDEGEKRYAEITEITERTMGPTHQTTIVAMHNLGWLYMDLEKHALAAEQFEKAVANSEKALPEGHWFIGAMRLALGAALFKLDRVDEAEASYLAAYGAMVESLGPANPRTQNAVKSLVELYESKGDPSSVEAWKARLADSS